MNKNLIILTGLPASGKSTVASYYAQLGYMVHSSDGIRKEIYGDESVQQDHQNVFNILHKRVRADLANGNDVVYDATNLNSRKRRHAIKECVKQVDNVTVVSVVVARDFNSCIKADSERDRTVGSNVLLKMYKSFQTPHETEGFSEVYLVRTPDEGIERVKIKDTLEFLDRIHQHNKHHTLTVGHHCRRAYELLDDDVIKNDPNLAVATLVHDIGKPVCMSFVNAKGMVSTNCHSHQHENVSAYDVLFLDDFTNEQLLDISFLVNNHMAMHHLDESKLKEKFGQKQYERLLILNKADKEAH